jgi:[protein-PII] uridylyltransferase
MANAPVHLPEPSAFDGKLSDIAREYVEGVRDDVEQRLWAGASGEDLSVRFAQGVDVLVRFIVDVETKRFVRRYARGARQQCGVIAQGGYGRSEMSPWSDVDLLIVYPGRLTPYVETVNERLLQTLFDAGLQVGWAVRTPRECLERAQHDVTIRTAMLDGRLVAGDADVGAQFTDVVQRSLVAKDAGRFVEQKVAEFGDRHAHEGGSVFLLEPNVKEGQGGLRDLHTLLWVGRVLRGIAVTTDLTPVGVATEREQEQLLNARDYLMRVRTALHVLTKFKTDKLSFELQEKIAERFRYIGDDRHAASQLFMRDYYSNAAIVGRTTADLIARLTAPPEPTGLLSRLSSRQVRDGVSVTGGQLLVEERALSEDPVNLVRVFADAQRSDVTLSISSQELVRRCLPGLTRELADSEAVVDVFMSILRSPYGVYRTLGEMNRLGVLGRMIPEFGRLFCMVQHDHYHVYTVDEHSLIGIRELERVREGWFKDESPLLTQVMRECDHPELLFLGMMFHDLGKGYGGDHDERGALMVRDVAVRLGLDVDRSRSLEFLVRHHLLMSMLAQNRDIDDPALVADFVKEVGTIENLRNLYLLTFADMKAVGPKVWSGWKDHLLGELYQRAMEAFETGAASEVNLDERIERARRRVLGEASGKAERTRLLTFLDSMPPGYPLSHTSENVVAHWRLCESLGSGLFRSGVSHFPERGFSELTVCATDRPGLFLRVCGVLSIHRLNVLGAKILTSSAGVAIDTFRVDHVRDEHEEEGPTDAALWARVRTDIEAALCGELDVEETVARTQRSRKASTSVRRARQRVLTRVGIDNVVARDHTVVEVHAADRPGLLFTLAGRLYGLGLVVHSALISTRVSQVVDIFYVTEADGSKVTDPERHERIREAILDGIELRDAVDA